jgi:hypothetical protein
VAQIDFGPFSLAARSFALFIFPGFSLCTTHMAPGLFSLRQPTGPSPHHLLPPPTSSAAAAFSCCHRCAALRCPVKTRRPQLLSFCLFSLNDGSIPNLCLITSLVILGISSIFHEKTSRSSQRKVMSTNSYLGSSFELIRSFLFGLLGSTRTSLSSVSMVPFSLLSAF